ncbi:hypothetical protein BJ508DRAFT_324723 [Ascobolus immersus RN42]|uniref:Uncharacterized protein n=1 Tax=Ascobolus immersus RN42 TaxID=1160509 RepID=A0A3N4IG69_ASCIM|nr:hypothetical protein BJ508DRAFT_324723 [Ascobolus immersus RN42]
MPEFSTHPQFLELSPSQRTYQCPMADGARIAPLLLQPFTFNRQRYSIPEDLVEWTGNKEDLNNPKLDLESLDLDEFERYLEEYLGGREEQGQGDGNRQGCAHTDGQGQVCDGQLRDTSQEGMTASGVQRRDQEKASATEEQISRPAQDPPQLYMAPKAPMLNRQSFSSTAQDNSTIPFEVWIQQGKDLQEQGLLPPVHPDMTSEEKKTYLAKLKQLLAEARFRSDHQPESILTSGLQHQPQQPVCTHLSEARYTNASYNPIDVFNRISNSAIPQPFDLEPVACSSTQQVNAQIAQLHAQQTAEKMTHWQDPTIQKLAMSSLIEKLKHDRQHAQTQEEVAYMTQATDERIKDVTNQQEQIQVQQPQMQGRNMTFQMSDQLRAFGMQLAGQGLPQHEIRKMLLPIAYQARTRSQAQLHALAKGQGQHVHMPPGVLRAITVLPNGQPLTQEQQLSILECYWQQVLLQQLYGKSPNQIQQLVVAGQQQGINSPAMQQMQPPPRTSNGTPSPAGAPSSLQQHPTCRNVSYSPAPQYISQPTPSPQPLSLINGHLLEMDLEQHQQSQQFRQELVSKVADGSMGQKEAESRFRSFNASLLRSMTPRAQASMTPTPKPQTMRRTPTRQHQSVGDTPSRGEPHQASGFQHQRQQQAFRASMTPQSQNQALPMGHGQSMRRTPSTRPLPALVVLSSDEGDTLVEKAGEDGRQ